MRGSAAQHLSFINIDHFCHSVDLSEPRPVIDLGSFTGIEPFALIYLGLFILHHNSRGLFFTVQVPASSEVQQYLDSQNFWRKCNIRPYIDPPAQIELWPTSFGDIVFLPQRRDTPEEIGRWVYDLVKRVPTSADVIVEIVEELVDNFVRHAETPTAACVFQVYDDRIEFAIGDRGIGIRKSLAQNANYRPIASHRQAIDLAFQYQVGRGEGGMGLPTVAEHIAELEGHLFLSTGNAWATLSEDGLTGGKQDYNLPGVQIEVAIPL